MSPSRTGAIRSALIVAAVLALTILAAQSAFAATAANNIIRNSATVDYQDASGTSSFSDTSPAVDVTVELVASTPVLDAPADQTTSTGTDAIYSYTVTSTANGPDTYNLTENNLVESAGISGSTSAFSVASIALGGSSIAAGGTIAAAGTTAIVVPSDGSADGSVNGIAGGDTVVINGQVFTVASVDDSNGGNPGTSTITVNGNGTDTPVAVGDQVGEQGTFTVTVTPGTVSAASDQTVTLTIDARDSGAAAAAASDVTVTTVQVAALTIGKVADVATAAPGDTITYTITVTNGGTSNATAVTVTDAVPQFTTYVANSTLLNGIAVAGDGAVSPLAGGLLVDDDGGRAAGAVATGVIQPGNAAVITFQVTVDN